MQPVNQDVIHHILRDWQTWWFQLKKSMNFSNYINWINSAGNCAPACWGSAYIHAAVSSFLILAESILICESVETLPDFLLWVQHKDRSSFHSMNCLNGAALQCMTICPFLQSFTLVQLAFILHSHYWQRICSARCWHDPQGLVLLKVSRQE